MSTRIQHGEVEALRTGAGPRSPEWRSVERAHLARQPHCACCRHKTNQRTALQVHHIFPFHYAKLLGRPDLELDDRNLITLCEAEEGRPAENHHLLVGHLDDFQSSNLRVARDASETFFAMTARAIRADHRWLAEKATRLKRFDEMTEAEKRDFVAAMNAAFPRVPRSIGSPRRAA